MDIYNDPSQDFGVEVKSDDSPLTKADIASHKRIVAGLQLLTPNIPIMSEEGKEIESETRKDRSQFRCVDPIDGTKEFIKRNGEFTVNIALVKDGVPVLGVVHVPAHKKTYAAATGEGAWLIQGGSKEKISCQTLEQGQEINIVGSRSHHAPEVEEYCTLLNNQGWPTSFTSAGSSLKICMIADGSAQVYPRFVPTMERDTAAPHCVLLEAGGVLVEADSRQELMYNKEVLRNPFFIAAANKCYLV